MPLLCGVLESLFAAFKEKAGILTTRWLHPFVLVRKYVKPEKIGSIFVGPAWRVDNSRSLWEVVETTPKATKRLGYELEEGWILITPPNAGVVIDRREDDEGFFEVFLIWAHLIAKVIPWTTKEEDVKMQPGTLWVRPERAETSSLLIDLEEVGRTAWTPRRNVGKVTRTHEAVKEVEVGDRVAFTRYVGVEMELGGEKLLVLREGEVLAKIGG